LAIDLPSGIHPDTGYHSGVFITAVLTLTLGLPKRGLVAPHARKYVGELKVLDIGFPKVLLTP
jgi:NAD(P)H-hydrate epimerase